MARKTSSLIKSVCKLLESIPNGNNAVRIMLDNNKIKEAMDSNNDIQRVALNWFWNLQLLGVGAVSQDARMSLIPNGECHQWLSLFQTYVLPFIIENNLPKEK